MTTLTISADNVTVDQGGIQIPRNETLTTLVNGVIEITIE